MKEVMLTTVDNPFNPFSDFEDWVNFDRANGYYTLEYLGRIAKTSSELSEADYELAIDEAINEIIELNVLGIYTTVENK